jgi:hypothetical protein
MAGQTIQLGGRMQRHRMTTAVTTMLVGAAFGCGSGHATVDTGASSAVGSTAQQFTRAVPAPAQRVVQAAVQTLGDYHIPVATADEAAGFVQSAPVDLTGDWGNAPAQDRVNCPSDAIASGQKLQFAVQVNPTATGSTLSLQAMPYVTKKGSVGGCVLKAEFLSRLLDDIANRAGA